MTSPGSDSAEARPYGGGPSRVSEAERILSANSERAENGCLVWTGPIDPSTGYGRTTHTLNGKRVRERVHRMAYRLWVGPLTRGLVVDHTCENKRCIEPTHLEQVTIAVNVERAGRAANMVNAAKTHCPRGHAYDAVNTYHNPSGSRACRACERTRKQTNSADFQKTVR